MKTNLANIKSKAFIFEGCVTAVKEKRTVEVRPRHNFAYWPFISFYEFVTYAIKANKNDEKPYTCLISVKTIFSVN